MSFNARSTTAAAASEAGFKFEPEYPGTSTPIGAVFVIRGPNSEAVRAHQVRRFDLAQARELQFKRRGKEVPALTLDELDAALTDLAVVYVMSWAGVDDAQGQPLACTPENVRQVFVDHPWLRDKVISEGQQLGNFIRPCAPTSLTTPALNSVST